MPTPEPLSLNALLRAGTARLREAGSDTAVLDARLLLCHVAGLSHAALVARGDEPASQDTQLAFNELIARRERGEPVARILGEREFWGLSFMLGPDTLVPRPDSECIVEAALAPVTDRSASLRILDLGTGTGCLLLSLLSELPNAHGLGVDIADGAVDVALENARALGLERRAQFVRGNWGEGVKGPFDIVISNPPYIPAAEIKTLMRDVREHDPMRALDGGADGLECYRVILKQLPELLAPRGRVVLETSPDLYAELLALVRADAHWGAVEEVNDLAGRARGMRFAKNDLAP